MLDHSSLPTPHLILREAPLSGRGGVWWPLGLIPRDVQRQRPLLGCLPHHSLLDGREGCMMIGVITTKIMTLMTVPS
jgi:hypothetical protein